MRILQFREKTARLSEEELRVLIDRYDVDKARLAGSTWTISASCICQNYMEGCQGCPFWQLNGLLGCMAWVREKLGEESVCRLEQDRIEWHDADDNKARKQVHKLRGVFSNLPRERIEVEHMGSRPDSF